MPLSEHEQRVLEQMEHALYAEDPRFASNLKKPAGQTRSRRRAVIGVVLAVLGLALVVLGVTVSQIWVGGIGFAAMVLGGVLTFTPGSKNPPLSVVGSGAPTSGGSGRGPAAKSAPEGRKKPGPRKGGGSFMQRMEERWDKRREQD
ncbi:MAG: DUF3040 domain-containing protein [Ornithinimicrobium sp.]